MCEINNLLGSSTLPRTTTRAIETEAGTSGTTGRSDKVAAATSSTSLYDNVTSSQPAERQPPPKRKLNLKLLIFILRVHLNL